MNETKEKYELMEGGFGDDIKRISTLDLNQKDNQVKMYNALQKCDIRLIDIKGQELVIAGLYVEEKDVPERDANDNIIVNESTGEIKTKKHFRTILFDNEGKTYVSTAFGVYNSIKTIASVFGMPSETNQIKVKVDTRKLQNGKESLILIVVNE